MAKKDNDTLLIVGALAIGAYFIFKKTTPVATIAPTTIKPVVQTPATSTNLLTQVENSGLVNKIVDLFKPDAPDQTPSTTVVTTKQNPADTDWTNLDPNDPESPYYMV